MELQGDVRVEAKAEVVVEHVQGQLRMQEKHWSGPLCINIM